MGETKEKVLELLDEPIPVNQIRTRKGPGGKDLSYIPHIFVVKQMTRIFGPDGWDSHIVDTKIVPCGENGNIILCSVTMRLSVLIDRETGQRVIRENIGSAAVTVRTPELIEFAVKSAASDAFKRAAFSLGRALGLDLYDDSEPEATEQQIEVIKKLIEVKKKSDPDIESRLLARLGINSVEEMTYAQADTLIKHWSRKDDSKSDG